MDINEAFYYIDGDPLNGCWIDLDGIYDHDDIREALAKANIIPRNRDGEPEYDGDLLVADTEGELASICYEGDGSFNLAQFIEVRDSSIEQSQAVAFIELFDMWDEDKCNDYYVGHFDSPDDFARDQLEQSGILQAIPDELQCYIDFERYAEQELLICSHCSYDGHYFYNL